MIQREEKLYQKRKIVDRQNEGSDVVCDEFLGDWIIRNQSSIRILLNYSTESDTKREYIYAAKQ